MMSPFADCGEIDAKWYLLRGERVWFKYMRRSYRYFSFGSFLSSSTIGH